MVLPFPVIDNDDLVKIRHVNHDGDMPGFITHVSRGLYELTGGGQALAARLEEICGEVSRAIADGMTLTQALAEIKSCGVEGVDLDNWNTEGHDPATLGKMTRAEA